MAMKKLSRGTYGVLLTPLTKERELNIDLLEKELHFCLDSDATGILVLGSTGEFPYLSIEQRKTMLKISQAIVQKNKTLIAGVSGYTEREVIDNLQISVEMGYSYAIICPPYYYPQSQKEVLEFYTNISKQAPSGLGLILYHIPFCTAGISLQTLVELSANENIIGLKDSSGDGLYFAKSVQMVQKQRKDFSIFTGQDSFFLPSLSLGGSGCMSALSWILHKEMKQILMMYDSMRIQSAMQIQHAIIDIVLHLDAIPFPENYRALAEVTQISCGTFQRWYEALSESKLSLWNNEADSKVQKIHELVGKSQ
ncbi:dihydrodipicolinate synthase family protein [Sphaerochaeta sp.]|jgi:dihydrodipicolinate synthase/N-acetylneuraminate lyase|uniref:dihydrodipicolinate synthase family protein n=1 Tax=Sphaerochaeta sp. TaxID=1972642 RepID=UPI002A365B5C|nr:dihydrodipicolinate synthase family protein [Sphaerochaeta sp.]MDX9983916.1 dihydrodipicolinate synthase family protein [Sphaerochaeta sp.]